MTKEADDRFINLHDAFLNASVVRDRMRKSSVVAGNDYLSEDRWRLERLWIGLLYVLIEAWCASASLQLKNETSETVQAKNLKNIIGKHEKSGYIKEMAEVRHYMFHRDKRHLWDPARMAPLGNVLDNEEIHSAFSEYFLKIASNIQKK
ncbi:MAG: hypothetical protein NVS3B29_00670 [Candidatus Saccharimonadales bacterium]